MRTKILRVATDCFAQAGYEGTSMRQIAEKVGIKAASLYNHFPSKSNILEEALENIKKNMMRFMLSEKSLDEAVDRDGGIGNLFAFVYRADEELFQQLIKTLRIVLWEQYRNDVVRSYLLDDLLSHNRLYIQTLLDRLKERGLLSCDSAMAADMLSRIVLSYVVEATHGIVGKTTTLGGPHVPLSDMGRYVLGLLEATPAAPSAVKEPSAP